MSQQEIKRQVDMNEMEKMVDIYFEKDPDLFINHENDEIYYILSQSNKYWNQLDTLNKALIPCSNLALKYDDNITYPSCDNFEQLILNIVENIYLCDSIELITFLLLIDNVDIMHKSFLSVLGNKNIPRYKRMEIIEIAIKYFTYQTINKLQFIEEYNENIQIIYDIAPTNITDIFSLNIIKDNDDDDDDDDEQEYKITIKDIVKCKQFCDIQDENIKNSHKKADSYFEKWCKLNKK